MNKTPWYWEDTAMLLLVPAILIFFLNVGIWFLVLNGEGKWYIATLATLSTCVIPAALFGSYVERNDQ